jgi:hypothetical protein
MAEKAGKFSGHIKITDINTFKIIQLLRLTGDLEYNLFNVIFTFNFAQLSTLSLLF